MILKFLGVKEFDIIEASDRVGGRCYTYEFPEDKEHPCPHNYYDIGAMRIPDIPTMKSTLALIKDLGLEAKKVPYILDFPEGGPVPPSMHWYTKGGPDEKPFEKVIREVIAKLGDDFDYEKLMALGTDNFSTRSWLMVKHEWTYEQTLEAEGADTSTGLFDQAFTETICDYSDFQAAKAKPWYRLEGGMSVITDTMRDRLASTTHPRPGAPSIKPILNSPVISMAINDDAENTIKVTRRDGETGKHIAKDYDMVFNTTAMAPLQRMDLQGLNLPKEILTGIRALSYDRATKVAIKFKTRWWKGFYQKPGQFGGVSSSDLPISNVVYPSWDDGDDTAAVLMVSYSWAQDATRMGALVPEYKEGEREPKKDDEIVRVCLENLVKLWSNEENPPSLEFLNEQYITHHAWAWSHDPYTGGAYALFGPGQFSNLYPPFQKLLCGRRLSICGEAVSAHHAWISGALDSAYVSLWQWLADRFHVEWIQRLKASSFGPGKGKDAEELDVTLDLWTVELSEKTGSQ
ncbi:L-amino acid oxidase [Ilyonectria robusta]